MDSEKSFDTALVTLHSVDCAHSLCDHKPRCESTMALFVAPLPARSSLLYTRLVLCNTVEARRRHLRRWTPLILKPLEAFLLRQPFLEDFHLTPGLARTQVVLGDVVRLHQHGLMRDLLSVVHAVHACRGYDI